VITLLVGILITYSLVHSNRIWMTPLGKVGCFRDWLGQLFSLAVMITGSVGILNSSGVNGLGAKTTGLIGGSRLPAD